MSSPIVATFVITHLPGGPFAATVELPSQKRTEAIQRIKLKAGERIARCAAGTKEVARVLPVGPC
jgi:hypothetical protein